MDLGLAGRVFVVTGGSRGLGRATAAALVGEGARVVLVAREQAALTDTVTALGGTEHAVGLSADITDPDAPERVVAGAVARYGRLDGALLSGGGPPAGSPLTISDDQWRDSYESIVVGPLRYARAIASATTPQPGDPMGTGAAIAWVLSSTVRNPIPNLAISNVLRPALAGLVKDLADELAPRGVRVTGLLPGRVATDRTFMLDARSGSPDMVRRRAEAAIPLGRYGEPDEFGRVAAFVLSPAASYVTGSLIAVDGGLLRSV